MVVVVVVVVVVVTLEEKVYEGVEGVKVIHVIGMAERIL
jgi:hypothetical protein